MTIRHSPRAQIMGYILLSQHDMLVKNRKTRVIGLQIPSSLLSFSQNCFQKVLFLHIYFPMCIQMS